MSNEQELGRSEANRPRMDVATRPTIIDVARLARVSPATVSNVLNERQNVDADTRKRVLAAVGKLGYTPNLRARRLRTGRADTIAIFSSMSFAIAGGRARLGFTMEIAAAAAARALENGIALVLVPPLSAERSPVHDLHIDGALVVEPLQDDREIALLKARGVPIVCIGREPGTSAAPFVDLRPYDVARLLIEHLHQQSARKIALIVGAQQRFTHIETARAYRDFAQAHDMDAIVRPVDEAGGELAGYASARELLSEHPELDALFVSVDVFAVGARRAADEIGRRVPQDLKLATRYDGIRARECTPPLTAVNLHLDEVASLGVELLLEHISGRMGRRSTAGPLATLVPRGSSVASE
jgi:DNA-binding LacI/PurR family transcriptional regulator